MYLALYRKYRPQNFDEVIGQNHIIQTLKNQIASDKIGHAYLFCGSRGTGKTSTAKIFAKAINCSSPINSSPCGNCNACKALSSNNIDILEIDAASNNGVDEIRDLREKVKYPPVNGKYKVYIIDEVHMLSPSAFNALLKTLEEPPSYAVFILATTEVHKIPATILSRCLRFDFGLVPTLDLTNLLVKVFKQENIGYESEALEVIARAGEGSVRDTLSIADRCISYSSTNLTYSDTMDILGATEKQELINLSNAILTENLGDSLKQLDKVLSTGKSPLVLSKDLIEYFRDLLIINTLRDNAKTMVVAREDVFEKMKAQASSENYSLIISAINNLSAIEAELRYSVSPRIVLETAFIKTLSQNSLLKRVENLEKMLTGNANINISAKPQTAEPAKTIQHEPEKQSNASVSGESEVLGLLINYLKENKEMSLLSAVRQIVKVELNGANVIFYVDDQLTLDIIVRDKYKQVLTNFFSSLALTYNFKMIEKKQLNISELSNTFKDKLTIKE